MKYIAVSNELICDSRLTPADRKVALALLSFRWEKKQLKKSLRFVAERANVCVNTARTALARLEASGYVRHHRQYRYDHARGRVVYSATVYTLKASGKEKYTLLPYTAVRSLLAARLAPSAVLTFLLLAMKQGQNRSHAFPSLRRSAEELGVAKATVCRALRALIVQLRVIRLYGKKTTGDFFCNSYYVIIHVTESALQPSRHHRQHTTFAARLQAVSPHRGGLIFDKLPINNITRAICLRQILRKETIKRLRKQNRITYILHAKARAHSARPPP